MTVVFLAEGFEEIEALATVDILRRAALPVTTVGIGGGMVRGSHGIVVQADCSDADFAAAPLPALHAVVLPGGMPGTRHLEQSDVVQKTIDAAAQQGAWLCAICAAPSILGHKGLLKGRHAVCYPGFEADLYGALAAKGPAVTDGRFITADGPGAALEFGLEIVRHLADEETARRLRASMQCR